MLATVDDLISGLDPAELMNRLGMPPDPWQAEMLRAADDRILLCMTRQAGKSTATSVLALHQALYLAGSLVLLVSPSLRQSGELFRKVVAAYDDIGRPVPSVEANASTLALENGARVVCLPGSAATIRGFSGVDLLIVDEAAQVPDDVFYTVSPMLAVSGGRLVALSTPFGKRGFFHDQWTDGGPGWRRFRVTAEQCPRIPADFLAAERAKLGPRWFAQEYMCSFEQTIDQFFDAGSVASAFAGPSDLPAIGGDLL